MNWPYTWIRKYTGRWFIILHHSLTKDSKTVSWDDIYHYHTHELGWMDVGYHYGIELIDGYYQIMGGRPLGSHGAHCRGNGMNAVSIGICFIGNYDEEDVPDAMYDVGIKHITGLCYSLRIGPENIFPHSDYADKTCPGIRFDLNRVRNEVDAIL